MISTITTGPELRNAMTGQLELTSPKDDAAPWLALLRRYGGWIALAVVVAVYYRRFSKESMNFADYLQGAACLLNGQPMLECAPAFPYTPAFALAIGPFLALSPGLQNLVWYAILVASTVACFAISEALARCLYPAAAEGRKLIWLRILAVVLGLKFALAVFGFQAHDTPVFMLVLVGLWGLSVGRPVTAGAMLAIAAALKATPLIFFPYLLLKRRFLAASVFAVAFLAVCLLPDLLAALKGSRSDYFLTWVYQIASPTLRGSAPLNEAVAHAWSYATNNQSLHGFVAFAMARAGLAAYSKHADLAASAAFLLAVGILLIKSPRRDDFVGIDGAILSIAMIMLSPMTSRYHYVVLILPYTMLAAAFLSDHRTRLVGGAVLLLSFILVTATSNDAVGPWLSTVSRENGFLPLGASVLLFYLAMIIWTSPRVTAAPPEP